MYGYGKDSEMEELQRRRRTKLRRTARLTKDLVASYASKVVATWNGVGFRLRLRKKLLRPNDYRGG
jgi:hypothetical protein